MAVAIADAPDESVFDRIGGGGGALSVHLGYDFWIADQWSLGAMLRWLRGVFAALILTGFTDLAALAKHLMHEFRIAGHKSGSETTEFTAIKTKTDA